MQPSVFPVSARNAPSHSPLLALPALALCFALVGSSTNLFGQTDDFNDGNDTGWVRYDPLAAFGLRATFSFPNGGYRIQTTYLTGMAENPGRAGTVLTNVYSDFYASVDVVDWDETVPQSFGLLARVGTVGLQTTTGYAFTWDRGNPTNATAGDVDISTITGEAPDGVSVTGSDSIHFEKGKKYRMVFIGRGAELEGRIYELPNVETPVIAIIGTDSTYPSGQNGMVVFDNSGGQNKTDATFDNFYATDIEPPRIGMQNDFFGSYTLSWPAEASRFVLQSSTVLTGTETDWTDVPATEIFPPGVTGRYSYSMAADPKVGGLPRQFFRLIRR